MLANKVMIAPFFKFFASRVFIVPVVSFVTWVPILEEDVPQDEKSVRYVKKSACLSAASLQILVTC